MRLPHLSDDIPEIPVVPLIDVMFTLLTFFIVATLYAEKSRAVKLDLPKSATTENLDKKKQDQVDVSVKANGDLYFNKDLVTEQELVKKVSGVAETTLIVLAGDENAEYQDITRAMNAIRQANRGQLALAAKNLEGK